MKKILIGIITFITIFSLSITTAFAAEPSKSVSYYAQTPGAANATNSIIHTHTGSNGSGCYTNKVISSYSKSCTQAEHSHDGNTTSGGACYRTENRKTKYYSWTSSSSSGDKGHHCGYDNGSDTQTTYRCSGCGATSTYTSYSCGHTSGSSKSGTHCSTTYVESYSKSCSTPEHSHWGGNGTGCYQTPNYSYNLGCGLGTTSVVGNGYITPSTTAITSSLTLTASIKNSNGLTITGYKWNTGATSAAITVTTPGTYTCTITYKEKGTTKTTSLSYRANNISHEIGKLTVSANKTTWTPSLVLTASNTANAVDNITNVTYSWKNSAGTVISSANTATITQNDTYTCTMSYKEGGVARSISCNYVVDQVDNSAPQVTVSVQKNNPVQDNNSFTVIGTDNITSNLYYNYQNQGWVQSTSGKTYTVTANGTYTVQVKDDAGNITTKNIAIGNITNIAPTINSITPNTTNMAKEVVLTVNATMNPLTGYTASKQLYYSLDNQNWQESNKFTIIENGNYTIYVKDAAGNQSSKAYGNISNINRTPPIASLSFEDTTWETEKDITVIASDDNPGLHAQAYRLFNGTSWTEWTSSNVFKVNKKGNYIIEVRDSIENTTQCEFSITHIDEEIPEVELVYDNINWELKKIITVNAIDKGMGLTDTPYRYSEDGTTWTEWTDVNTYEATKNGMYYVEIKDNANLVTQVNCKITYIDTEKPIFTLSFEDTSWEKFKEITVTAEDAKSGLHEQAYRVYNGIEWTDWFSSNPFNIADNGLFTIEVRDKLGNYETATFEITHVDRTPPEGSVTFDDVTWELEKTITVSAFDDGIGLTDKPFRYSNDNEIWTEWTDENTYEVTANGTYYVEIIDKSDLVNKISYEVTHVDREIPEVELNYDDSWGTSKTLVINAKDTKSGLHKLPYRFFDGDKWTDWNSINAYKITKNGTYSVEVKDILENTYSNSINITTIDDTPPVINNIEVPDDPAKNKEIKIDATDEGVGLANKAYSYSTDGKNWSSWTNNNSYTINKNGTLYVKVKDSVGNISESSKEVTGIDNEPPVIEIIYDDEKSEQTKKISIKTDEKDLVYRICIDNVWSDWTNKGEWEVNKNSSYKIQAMDKAGNITSTIATITNIDTTKPTVKITFDDDNLSQNKIVKVEVEDDNLPENFIRVNGGEWTNTTYFEFTQNGIYTIEVRDIAGNITSYTFEIKSILNEGPEIKIVYDNTKWEQTKVAYVELINPAFNADTYQYSFYTKEGWQPYSNDNSITLTENGIYSVKIRDELANVTTLEYEITKIDSIAPNVELIYDKETYSTDILIEIEANDEQSGISGKSYRYYINEWSEWSSDNKFTLEQNGAFSVEVKDIVGNITTIKETVNIIDDDAPEVELYVDEKTNTIRVIAKDYGSGLANKAYKWNDEDWTNLAIREFEDLDNITIEVRDSVGNSVVLNSKSIEKGFTVNQLTNENTNQMSKKFREVASTAAGILGISAVAIFLFLYFKPRPKIGVMRNEVFNEVCEADIKVKAYWVEVDITQAIIDKAQSESLTILFNDGFIKKHKNKSLRVNLPEEEITMKLEKVVEL